GGHYRGPDVPDERGGGSVVELSSWSFTGGAGGRSRMHDRPGRKSPGRSMGSAAQAEPGDEAAVTLDVLLGEVREETLTLTDEQHQAAARVVVVRVRLEVLGEVRDSAREQRHLDLRRTGVTLVGGVLADDGLLDVGIEGHTGSPEVVARSAGACSPGHASAVAGFNGSIQTISRVRRRGSPAGPRRSGVRHITAAVLGQGWTGTAGRAGAGTSRTCATVATSWAIWSSRAGTPSKVTCPRSRRRSSTTTSSSYRSRSVRPSTYASTVRSSPWNVGLVPTETAAGSRLEVPSSGRWSGRISQPA